MGILQQVEHWGTTHHPKWLVVLRVALGICLFIKGISFISDTAQLQLLLAEGHFTQSFPWLSYIITWVHLFGGFLIIIGLLTRFAVILQIPILLGAVFFINISDGIFASSAELWLSIIILLLLFIFFIEGGGPLSLDNYFKKNPK
jgi:putative oxidoreductase